jgi:glycerol-3-phosphate dehydrogenase
VSAIPERVDVLVVGLGIHGAGVLQAAAAAGHSALAVEERAPAAGTSSRSSKLIHGGLRYLETGQFQLVRESLAERAILLEIAPHLVRLVEFFIPVFRATRRRPWEIRAGLSLYAVLGGLVREARFARVPRGQWDGLDGLATEGLQAVFRYHDGQTDDAALVRAVIASARELGAEVACPAALLRARRGDDLWRVTLAMPEGERELEARVLVVAAGPWAAQVQGRVEGAPAAPAVELVGGAHVELAGRLERGIYYVEAPADRRAVFAMPWKGRTLVGTTETPFSGDPALVRALPAEIEYLCATFAAHFPGRPREPLDAWAGLRVLPRGPGRAFSRPREVVLSLDDELEPRFVGLYGGKLTGYRATAAKVLERIAPALPLAVRRADTATLRLPALPPG